MGRYRYGRRTGAYKSKFESTFSKKFPSLIYEVVKLPYIVPASKHNYNPDWKVTDNLFLETKGMFGPADRQKMLLVKEQHPDIEIIFVFTDPDKVLGKRLGTVSQWCKKNGFRSFGIDDKELYDIIEGAKK